MSSCSGSDGESDEVLSQQAGLPVEGSGDNGPSSESAESSLGTDDPNTEVEETQVPELIQPRASAEQEHIDLAGKLKPEALDMHGGISFADDVHGSYEAVLKAIGLFPKAAECPKPTLVYSNNKEIIQGLYLPLSTDVEWQELLDGPAKKEMKAGSLGPLAVKGDCEEDSSSEEQKKEREHKAAEKKEKDKKEKKDKREKKETRAEKETQLDKETQEAPEENGKDKQKKKHDDKESENCNERRDEEKEKREMKDKQGKGKEKQEKKERRGQGKDEREKKDTHAAEKEKRDTKERKREEKEKRDVKEKEDEEKEKQDVKEKKGEEKEKREKIAAEQEDDDTQDEPEEDDRTQEEGTEDSDSEASDSNTSSNSGSSSSPAEKDPSKKKLRSAGGKDRKERQQQKRQKDSTGGTGSINNNNQSKESLDGGTGAITTKKIKSIYKAAPKEADGTGEDSKKETPDAEEDKDTRKTAKRKKEEEDASSNRKNKHATAKPSDDEQDKGQQKKHKKEKSKTDKKEEEKKEKEKKEEESECSSQESEAEDDGKDKKLQKAEGKINSTTHRKEYMSFKRWINNGRRLPAKMQAAMKSEEITAQQETRATAFRDFIECDGDTSKVLLRHEQRLEESQRTEIKWGFRGEKWTIQDPELPDDKDERLFFTMINLDISNISELRRLTQLEMEGCIDKDGLAEFTKGGGVLDPSAHLKVIDFTAGGKAAEALSKVVGVQNVAPQKGKGNKKQKKEKDTVVPETPLGKAQILLNSVLKHVNVEKYTLMSRERIELGDAHDPGRGAGRRDDQAFLSGGYKAR
ncbi:unnamed protein product [Effrenium voratum]|nr:unnamed protein product [Effrenium voratum]